MGTRYLRHTGLFAALLMALGSRVTGFTHDVAWVFGASGSSAYVLTSFTPADAALGALGGHNPALTLRLGRRYQVTVTSHTMHPLEILGKGAATAQDSVLLSMQPGVSGTLEGDASVTWEDDGAGTVAFTVSPSLVSAMLAGGLAPGYRCRAHPATMRGSFLVAGLPLSDPLPQPLAKGSVRVGLTTLVGGLTAPLDLRPAPDGSGRLLVTDQAGSVRIVQGGSLRATPFLDVSSRLVSPLGILGSHDETDYDERGLLGFAIHPDFATPAAPGFRKVYTYTSEPNSALADFTTAPLPPGTSFDHQNVIAEWTVDAADPDRVDPASRREILRVDQPQFNHNGGMLSFDPDGYLLIGCGDGGAGNDVGEGHGPAGNGQDLGTVQGSLLRIDPLPTGARDAVNAPSANGRYRIPATNPFAHADGLDEIYAYGLRNPYRFSLDPPTGRLVVADVGQDHVEEISLITAGANAGWRLKEGTFRFNPVDGSVTDDLAGLPAGLLDPVAQYDHDEGSAIVGGFVYRGSALPELAGKYVFGDFSRGFTQPGGRLFTADLGTGLIEELIIGLDDRPLGLYLKGFGVDAAGELYVLGSTALGPYGTTGVVLQLTAPPPQHLLTYLAGPGGSLNGTNPQRVDHGSNGTPVTAQPATGYHFVQWSDGAAANPRLDSAVTADLTVTALFAINTYTLTYLAGPGGTIDGTTPQTVNHGSSGTPVTAQPAPGFHFARWSDGATANPRTDVGVTAGQTVTAQFTTILHTVRFEAGAGGRLSGTLLQTVPEGGSATPVSAVADYRFVLAQWDDGATANPRTLTAVTADLTLTASFRPATPVAPSGSFLAIMDGAAVAAGRGLWELSGAYTLPVAGQPLVLNLVHDSRGRLTGTASYTTSRAAVVTMPVRASLRGRDGKVTARIVLHGADAAKTTAVSLTLALTLDTATRHLRGPVVGSVTLGGTTAPVATTASLAVPAPEDGTWTLLLQLTPARTTTVSGTALLTLANGATQRLRAAGRVSGSSLALSLIGEPSDPAAIGIAMRATLATLEGDWAVVETAAVRGFGQVLMW